MKQLLNTDWSFAKAPLDTSFEDFSHIPFQKIDLPHDYMIYHTKDLYEEGISCYKRTLSFQDFPTGQTRFGLYFEGVYMDAKIYWDDTLIFTWKHGYSPFYVDVTPYLSHTPHTLQVFTNYRLPNSRWYPGSGIYRDVWAISTKDSYLPLNGNYISTKECGDTWQVLVDTEYVTKVPSTIRYTLYDEEGTPLCQNDIPLPSSDGTVTTTHATLTVEDPKLWDTVHPNLYPLKTELLDDTLQVLDHCVEMVGFRSIFFDPDHGFFLNGRHLEIYGSCEHHTLGALGAACNKEALRRQFQILKDMGVNAIRNAHNMPPRHTLELCDEMGLLLYTESFDMWERTKTDHDYGNDFKDWWEKDVTAWVRSNRNHPCVFIWGIGNEIYDTQFERGLEITQQLYDAVLKLDPRGNAKITIASNYLEFENSKRCADRIDLVGYNYLDKLYDAHHAEHKDWVIYGSETASTLQSRGIYHFPKNNRLLTYEDEQCSALGNCTTNWGAKNTEHVLIAHRDRPYVFGQFIWTGFDYLGEPTPYFTKNSYFGQVDTAGFPKDSYYLYKSMWNQDGDPFVHLLPFWDFNDGQIIDIRAYTNAPEVELFFNDISQGLQTIDHAHGDQLSGDWTLPYREGTLTAVAYNENHEEVARCSQSSFSDAASIRLTPHKDKWYANGEDLVYITVETFDKNGVYVANSRSRIFINVEGPARLIGLDNGDSTDFDPYKSNTKKLFSGKLVAIVASTKESGTVTITATSPGLSDANVTLISRPYVSHQSSPYASEYERTHISCIEENEPLTPDSPDYDQLSGEVPLRKISLIPDGATTLTPEHTEVRVQARLYPQNTTYRDIQFQALTLNGVISNAVSITMEDPTTACIHANGDGVFRLVASCNNGKEHAEILSELEFEVRDLGDATKNAFELVSAIDYSDSSDPDLILSFQGGVYITCNQKTYVAFDNVDFGDYGSDEIHLPIFSFEDSLPVEIWDDLPDSPKGTCLAAGTYEAKSWYNHYQENTFRLSRRLKGIHRIVIVVDPHIKMSLQGFYFTRYQKAYAKLWAGDCSNVTGDSFTKKGDILEEIGNNVTVEYQDITLDQGLSAVRIFGRSYIETNTIHFRFVPKDPAKDPVKDTINQIVEFPYSKEPQELVFPFEDLKGEYDLNLIFLPGSKFDLHWFQLSHAVDRSDHPEK